MLKKIKLIAPSNYQDTICMEFAKQMAIQKDHHYRRTSGEGNYDMLKNMIWAGKMAEMAVFNTLIASKRYSSVSIPDIMIYEVFMKSFAADLVADGKQIHVKSFIKIAHIPLCWQFNLKDPLIENPTDNDMLALVEYDVKKNYDCYFVPAKDVVGMYKPPYYEKKGSTIITEKDLLAKFS